jgi:hypothetical protein
MFVGAAKYRDSISGNAEYVSQFEKRGPRDEKGRSLRDFDLQTKLFKHPVSFLIYSMDFDTLPAYTKDYVYRRIADVLEGREHDKAFGHIARAERRAALEILAETKPDFRSYISTRAADASQ